MNSPLDQAVDKALRTLAKTDRTRAEIESRLKSGGFPDEIVVQCLARLESWGYLDDQRVAKREVEHLAPAKGIGKNRVRARILSRGVDEDLAEQALQPLNDQEETQKALALLQKKYPPEATPTEQAKAGRFLLQRGFEEETVRQALARHFPAYED